MPERWLVLSARPASEEMSAAVVSALLELGGTAVQEQGGVLETYLSPPDDLDALLLAAGDALLGTELQWRWQQAEDWAQEWKRGLGPRQISARLVVKPSWTSWNAADGEVVLDIDPEMAFGTGEHATTRGCLRLLDAAIRPGDRVLDVGSGSAILAIAAARLGAGEVVALEYDPDANLNARDNLERNGVADRVRIVEALADAELLGRLGRFDLVLANILSGVIRPLLPAFRSALAPGGRLIVSGILQAERQDVKADADAAGMWVTRVDEEADQREGTWWSALLEPREP